MFFGGAMQVVAVMMWWLLEMTTRYGVIGHPMVWPITPGAIHAYLMIYGLFPFFMFGFLMTTFPRWMNCAEITAKRYIPAFLLLMLGAVCFYAGLLAGKWLLIVATLCALAGWGIALYALLRVLLGARHPDKSHPLVLLIALGMGWGGLAAYPGWLLSDNVTYLNFSIQCGLWLFLAPVFASVAHRMIPFFTASALPGHVVPRPLLPWWIMLAAGAAHGVMKLANAETWLWVCDVPFAVAALYLSYVWGMRDSLRIPLLGVLHIGFAWMGVAMLLFSVQSLLLFLGHDAIWGLAPLHALTIGCYATLIIGMGTRVTLGHSGLPMTADRTIRLMFAGIQLVVLMRVTADMLPMNGNYRLYIAAGAVWLVSFIPWVLRYLPFYWRPRADGQAG